MERVTYDQDRNKSSIVLLTRIYALRKKVGNFILSSVPRTMKSSNAYLQQKKKMKMIKILFY